MLMEAVAQTWIFKTVTAMWMVMLYCKFLSKEEVLDSSFLKEANELKQKVNALREEVQYSRQSIAELRSLS